MRRLYPEQLATSEKTLPHFLYLEKRKDNMRYGWFRKKGYYIGSGHVEAPVRVVIVRHCRQAGRHALAARRAARMSAIHAHYRSHRTAA